MKYFLNFLFLFLYLNIIECSKAEKIFQYAVERVGCGYIWGGSGQILTEEKLKNFKSKYPSFIDVNKDKKWLGKQVFDCSGLVKCAFENVGIYIPHEATSAWKNTKWVLKGNFENLPKDKVSILYRKSYHGMCHTAIYLGNGEVVDAKGNKEGVVREPLNSSWDNFGIPLGLY